ncbi:MAG: hypothetical protein HC912_09055 [Saprospiraceae bacterium]|nr:hypothetical protein [Saprospiraceae bacterium]
MPCTTAQPRIRRPEAMGTPPSWIFEAELDLAESSFYLKHRRKNSYELLYTQASQAAAEYLPEQHLEELLYIDAIFPEKNTEPEKTKTVLLPLYYEEAQLKAFLLLSFRHRSAIVSSASCIRCTPS